MPAGTRAAAHGANGTGAARAMRRMRSGVGRSRSTVKPDGTSDNSERGSRTGHGKQSGSRKYGHSSRIVHRPAPKLRKNPYLMSIRNFEKLLRPHSVALIGASEQTG